MAKSKTKAPAKKSPAKKKPVKNAAPKKQAAKAKPVRAAAKPKKTAPKSKSTAVAKPAKKKAGAPKSKTAKANLKSTKSKSTKGKGASAKAASKAKPASKAQTVPETVAIAPAPSAKTKRPPLSMDKTTKKVSLRKGILSRKAAAKPIAFSLDEIRDLAKTATTGSKDKKSSATAAKPVAPTKKIIAEPLEPAKPSHVKAASLADILGFNPNKPKAKSAVSDKPVPAKFQRFYKLLVGLRDHLTAGIELHSEETLKRSAKDDAGDLSSYGQHMADAGTDTFDRDFALSLVSSEQEALSEIEAAIKRIHNGTYGVCEITGKAIAKERLSAVPFTRYSTEAQKELERNRHRTRTQAGLFGEHGDDVSKLMDVDGDGD